MVSAYGYEQSTFLEHKARRFFCHVVMERVIFGI